jgi:hypothetical protein
MSWHDLHKQSAELAFKAGRLRLISRNDAEGLYRNAAEIEVRALGRIPHDKPRTRAIIGLSAASLLFKATEFRHAANLSLSLLAEDVPEELREQLQGILQAVWSEESKTQSAAKFLPGQVIVSLSGGEIVTGGAPLDLIVSKVQNIQNIFIRTIEYLSDLPFRRRGPPPIEVRDYCRPWLFQAPAGSYQFAVAVEAPKQSDMFKKHINPSNITDKFLDIMQAAASESVESLENVVNKEDYREGFVKLTRNLSPTGKSYEKVRIYSYDNPKEVTLSSDARIYANDHIVATRPPELSAAGGVLTGVLRALDLDRDWLELDLGDRHQRVTGLEDAVDDIIGPLVNKRVQVNFVRHGRNFKFVDIQEAE